MTTNLISHFSDWMTNGIFHYINEWAPWVPDEGDNPYDPMLLDMEYFGNHSGDKAVSPLVKRMTIFKDDVILSDEEISQLSEIIRVKYSLNWERLWKALQEEYKALENYSMIEERTPDLVDKTKTNVDSKSTTKSNTDYTVTTKGKNKEKTEYDNENKIKGFGSADYAGISKTEGESTQSGLVADNEQEARTQGTANNNYNEVVNEADATKNWTEITRKGKDTLTRSGNIGVTTSQQMLESEFELRRKHFFDRVMEDIDMVLTCPYWGAV